MKTTNKWADRVRRGEELPQPLAALLGVASVGVRAGMWWRHHGPRFELDARVISFGNITAGGTGKTPAVIERARREIAAGHNVAVLTRGYGSKRGRACVRGKDLKDPFGVAEAIGDEPALIAWKEPEVVVVKDPDRVAGGLTAIKDYHCDVLILDDGYQYVRLERDENILVIDAVNPFGNGQLIPRGTLREPIIALERATALLLTRCDQSPHLETLERYLAEMCPDAPIRMTRHAPSHVWRITDRSREALDYLRDRPVHAVCAIGNPEAFFATLEGLGAELLTRRAFRNHGRIPRDAIPGDAPVVTTEKDAIRMGPVASNLWAIAVELADFS